jgi:hypothetical protein
MKRVCSWCRKDMGEKPGEGITHGMCPECVAEFSAEFLKEQGATGVTVEDQIQSINRKAMATEAARLLLAIVAVLVGTLIVGYFLPME